MRHDCNEDSKYANELKGLAFQERELFQHNSKHALPDHTEGRSDEGSMTHHERLHI